MSELSKSQNEVFSLRKEKEENIKASSLDSFPTSFKNSTNIKLIHQSHSKIEEGAKTDISVSVRGRILAIRSFGKLTFIDLSDDTGKIQLVSTTDLLSDELQEYISNIDVGDIAGASGTVMKTKKGELSIELKNFILLTKSFRNFPEKWHGLKDKETRFRQRYLDLIVNPESKKILEIRSDVVKLFREYLHSIEFIEVETPILQSKAGGAIAKPFQTHHNALNLDMYLRIAPELYLKRLVIGGFEKVFEIGKIFRNEGIDQTHQPEFTMLESYQAYADMNIVMDMVENMCEYVFDNLEISKEIEFNGEQASFSRPWKRVSMFDLVSEKLGIEIKFDSEFKDISSKLNQQNINFEAKTLGILVFELFENFIEKDIKDPTFVTDYPVEVSPFAREKKDQKGVTDRFELFAFGSELANGFSELIDSEEQSLRLKEQAIKKSAGDEEAHVEDEDYVEALQYGLPPTGGLGFGIDRFIMILVGKPSIREVITFTHLKPEN